MSEDAKSQGIAQFQSISEMVAALNAAIEADDDTAREDAERAIHEDALSVEVRSDWYAAGGDGSDAKPAEYRILLCTGGPAVQITGKLSEYGEPETGSIQVQDWFEPWTDLRPDDYGTEDYEEIILAYARCFWFGE